MAAHTWNADIAHSSLQFSVRHMMISKVRGRFTDWSASLTLDDADLSKSSTRVSVKVGAIDTSEAKRDGHLKSPDFFDAERLPEATFISRRVEGEGDRFKVVGDLALHGVTRELVLEVERTGSGKDPWGNERQGFSAKTHFNRGDFGLKWNQALDAGGVLVGEKVELEIELSCVKAKSP
jgi:polyisoprenoid-binding protein YceI